MSVCVLQFTLIPKEILWCSKWIQMQILTSGVSFLWSIVALLSNDIWKKINNLGHALVLGHLV